MPTPPNTPGTDLPRLQVSEDGQILQAIIEPRPDAATLNTGIITEHVKASGYGDWLLFTDAIASIPKLASDTQEATTLDIAKKCDAEMSVTLDHDELIAHLTIIPPHGGHPVTEEDVLALLARHQVTHGVLRDVIAQAVATQTAEAVVVARGTPPVNGADTRFESLLHEISDRRPKLNENGTVDYREINTFCTVHADVPLLRRIPFTIGEAGTSVTGRVIPATPGGDLPFAAPFSGVRVDDNDKNILVSAIGGQAVLIEHGARVEPIINLETVDLSTGNIHFDGAVNVSGDVVAGLRIQATGDVFIAGTVEGANIESGGNLKVNQGIIGRGDLYHSDGSHGSGIARIKAKGSVQARFIENAVVETEGDVIVDELLAHCDIKSEGAVVVGKPKAKKGHILGGSLYAVHGIKAQVIGSISSVRTRIEAGMGRILRARMDELHESLIAKSSERDKLTRLVEQANKLPADIGERARNSLANTEQELEELNQQREQLHQQLAQDPHARIEIGVMLHEGTTILLGEKKQAVERDHGPGSFTLGEGEIVYTPA